MDDNKKIEQENKILELENNWKRALADYKNLEKRYAEERFAMAAYANTNLLVKLLPVLDTLEMVSTHIDDTGLKMTIKEFKQVLSDEGVMEIDATNKEFDSTQMDAIDTIEVEEDKKNKVIEIIAKGYKLKDKLIRPARVKVGK
jgi:molecular chaperone GrpE